VITPAVLWGGTDPALAPDPGQVRSLHRISFTESCRPDSPRFITIPESDHPVVQIIGGYPCRGEMEERSSVIVTCKVATW